MLNRKILFASFLSSLSLFPITTNAGNISNGKFTIPTINSTITVDAILDEKVWQQAAKIAVNIEMSPGENTAAPVKTTAYIMANEDTLFIAFEAFDSNPQDIRAFYRQRDQIWNDDIVGIKLDTYNDGNKAYQFFVNPLGVQSDAIENELIGRESTAWDVIWDAMGKVTEDGYRVEMAIPLRVFNFKEKQGLQDWGIELVRFYPRDVSHRISNSPRDRQLSCTLCQMSVATGLAGIKQSSQIQLVPTLTGGKSQSRDVHTNQPWQSKSSSDVGLDLKWAISPDVSLYATVNPDFSQIEADSGQLNVNNSFSLFNRERRGFFLDDADFFEVPFQNLFYTRNVVAPKVGAKLTGRQGQHSFAIFGAQDKETLFVLPGNLSSTVINLEAEGNSGAMRYRYDASQKLSIGGLTTMRQSGDYHNITAAIDLKYRPTDSDTLQALVVNSNTQYPDDIVQLAKLSGELALRAKTGDDFSGQSVDIQYRHSERDWNANISYRKKSEGYRADLGFVNQVDAQKFVIGGELNWYLNDQWLNRIRFGGDWDISHNAGGDLIEKEQELYVKFNGEYQSFLKFSLYNRDKVGLRDNVYNDFLPNGDLIPNTLKITGNTKRFNEYGAWIWSEITPAAGITARFLIEQSREIDLANNRMADRFRFNPEFDWNITDHLLLKLRHRHQTMDSDSGQIFQADMTDLRLIYQFDVRQSLRFTAINLNIDRDPREYLFDEAKKNDKSLGTQLVYSYKFNAQTLVYVGYQDLSKITKDQRSVFVKFSYAWLN
ncbi:MAG: carbohydrate binding family 9 domain-containing protein [Gammaproteobacteria bacterium]|nr:carbohydrate binding family 9 domain-containing protein [Gammaproteobacteria bacterium]